MKRIATILPLLTGLLFSIVLINGCGNAEAAQGNDAASLYAQYNDPNYELASKDTDSQLLALAEEQLKLGNYKQGITHLENYLAEHPNAPHAILALAVTQAHLGEYRLAKTYLKILEGTGQEYEDAGYWELAMVYLKQGFPQASIFNLQQVSPAFPKYDEAKELISKLKWLMEEEKTQ